MTTPSDDDLNIPTNVPAIGLDMDPETAHYVGILEGTIAAMCINEAKYRALLELLTGESWEGTKIDVKGNVLMSIAAAALVKQTGMAPAKAQSLVALRWGRRNHPATVTIPKAVPLTSENAAVPASSTLADRAGTSTRSPVDESGPTAATTMYAPPDMSKRFQAWKKRQLEAVEKTEEN